MSGKRQASRRWSNNGSLTDSGANQVYAALREAIHKEQAPDLDGRLPIDGTATILQSRLEVQGPATVQLRRNRNPLKLRSGGALPHPDDVRAMLWRALATLETTKKPEILYLKTALRRHLELGVSLDVAIGYAKVGKGAPPFDQERARAIACAVFKHRFIDGGKADRAGVMAGKRFGMGKTQALAAFAAHDGYALETFKIMRLRKYFPKLTERYSEGGGLSASERQLLETARLWGPTEKKRLLRYYSPRQLQISELLDSQPD